MNSDTDIFTDLMDVLHSRRRQMPAESYTTKLYQAGVPKIGKKICEEAEEVIEAAEEAAHGGSTDHLVHEVSDLLYHLFVMLGLFEVPLEQVKAELQRRFGTSGLAEKAARGNKPNDPPQADPPVE